MATVEERLKKIIKDQFDIDDKEFVPYARLIEDFRADSLDLVEIQFAIAEEFHLPFGGIDIGDLLIIKDALAYLKKHVE